MTPQNFSRGEDSVTRTTVPVAKGPDVSADVVMKSLLEMEAPENAVKGRFLLKATIVRG